MAAYVVLVQVAEVRLQRVERGAADPTRPAADPIGPEAPSVSVASAARAASADDPVPIDIVGRGLGSVIRERWTRAAEIWSQTTFFLFDPNSWR